VTLRRVPAALALGLVAALAAHAALFDGGHAMGGAYAGILVDLAALGGAGLAATVVLLAGARTAADGTVLAARIRELLPGWGEITTSGALWYALGERLEVAHAGVPFFAVVVILALAAWLVLRVASAALRALADIVFAIVRLVGCQAEPIEAPLKVSSALARAHRDTVWRARLLRAPPVIANA